MGKVAHPGRQTLVLLGALVALVASIAAGAWGLAADRGEDGHGHVGPAGRGWAAVPGGWLRVSDATTRSMDHGRVPGMATMPDADPVPSGMVRIRVGVVLAAGDEDLTWGVGEFRLTGTGTPPLRPHTADLGDGLVPGGSQVSGGLVFDVPEESTDLMLGFRGEPRLPVEIDVSGQPHAVPPSGGPGHGPENHVHDDTHGHPDDDQH